MTFRLKWLLLAILLTAIAVGTTAWLMHRPDRPISSGQPVARQARQGDVPHVQKPAPPDQGYVGSERCGQCHAAVVEAYRSHPMSRSLVSLKDLFATEIAAADHVVEPPGPRKYRVRHADGRMWHHEFLLDPNGEPIYDQQVEVTFALGSGSRGRAYLLEREGRLFASPLNWYANNQQWGLAPGYSPTSHKRFEREVGTGCLVCHAGRLNEAPAEPSELPAPFFSEHAIGCERCHGPGQRHAEWHSQRREQRGEAHSKSNDVDPIVNPAKLDVARREDVCNQCHLQGESQQLRYGRDLTDFRPGMRLEDVLLIFVSNARSSPDGPPEVISQVEQMRSSTCYARSDGRLGCLSCHDAHTVPTSSEKSHFYREKCQSCHSDAQTDCRLPEAERLRAPEANSCIACHMPSLGTSNVPHTSQTDHRILRQPKSNRPVNAARARNSDLVFFDNAQQRIPDWEARRARGLLLASLAEQSGGEPFAAEAESLLEATRAIVGDDVSVIEWLGVAKLRLRKFSEARTLWETGLELEPQHEGLLVRLAFFSHDTKDLPRAAAYFDRLLALNPAHAAFHGRQAHILGQIGNFDRAIQEANRAIELDPTLSQAHEWLAQVHRLRQQTDKSQFHEKRAQQLRQAGF